MNKSTLVKWAVAAILAAPAVPAFARTTHHKALTATKSHHRLVTKLHRRTSLSHRSTSAHKLTSKSRHAIHANAKTTKPQFKVHVTHMPPTIDGIHA
jgi:hypothetical protein